MNEVSFVDMPSEGSDRETRIGLPWKFTFLVGLVTIALWPLSSRDPNNFFGLAFIFFSLSLSSITGVWCAIARPWWRYLIGILATGLLGFAIMKSGSSNDELMVFLVAPLIVIPIVITLEAIKLLFGFFTRSHDVTGPSNDGLQFGISHLMILTAVVAVLISAAQWLAPVFQPIRSNGPVVAIVTIATVIAFNTLTSVWALMGFHIRYRIWIAIVLAIIAIFLGTSFSPGGFRSLWALMFGVVWTITVLLLAFLRRDGCRFVRKKPRLADS